MKKVVITGKNSYIGEMVKRWLNQETDWLVESVDTKNDAWKKYDFCNCDAVFHVAGIAHQKITDANRDLYYSVNCDLAIEIATAAKYSGVKQFVFLSSMSVYSDSSKHITDNTLENPDNDYGKGKLLAEKKLKLLEDEKFCISIIRPPMVYGKGCKGNYNSLRKIALTLPVFPKVNNRRSMIYIDNLAAFVFEVISRKIKGTHYPQNKELVNTSIWAYEIAKANNKNIHISKTLGCLLSFVKSFPIIKNYYEKAFTDGYYDLNMSQYDCFNYQIVSFEESIYKTER